MTDNWKNTINIIQYRQIFEFLYLLKTIINKLIAPVNAF